MKKKFLLILICFALILNLFGKTTIKFNGYYKSFLSVFSLPDEMSGMFDEFKKTIGSVSNNLQLKSVIKFNNTFSFEAAYNIIPTVKDPELFSGSAFQNTTLGSGYRLSDLKSLIYPKTNQNSTSFGIYQNLDRFFLSIQTDFADIFIGRQPLAWGSARVINPTDILSPFTFNELDKEERRGVDAIRVRIPIGDMGELDIGYVANDEMKLETSAVFVRGKTELFNSDVSISLIKFYKNLLLGADISGAIGGAGFWIEAAYVFSSLFGDSLIHHQNSTLKNYFRLSAGLEYSFSDKIYAFAEYHFNSLGENDPDNYLSITHSQEFQEGSMYLSGKHYINLGLTYTLTPLTPVNGLIIYNVKDHSMIFSPTIELNISQNIYIALGGYFAIGKKARVLPSLLPPSPVLPTSEFGFSPSIIYSSFRVYF